MGGERDAEAEGAGWFGAGLDAEERADQNGAKLRGVSAGVEPVLSGGISPEGPPSDFWAFGNWTGLFGARGAPVV